MAKYDITAFMEFIKENTGVKNMTVFAHSMGTQQMFYNMITNKTYFQENVNLFIATGPFSKASELSVSNFLLFKSFVVL
mgnify:CR=1 FL=1